MRIARLRTDNGAEITEKVMEEWTTDNFVVTDPETPCKNGNAEVSGGNTLTVARSMQITANTSAILQGYAIHYATYIENRLFPEALSKRLKRQGYHTSPYQELYGEPASFQHCYSFCCAAYYYLGKCNHPGWKRQAREFLPSLLAWATGKARKPFFCTIQ